MPCPFCSHYLQFTPSALHSTYGRRLYCRWCLIYTRQFVFLRRIEVNPDGSTRVEYERQPIEDSDEEYSDDELSESNWSEDEEDQIRFIQHQNEIETSENSNHKIEESQLFSSIGNSQIDCTICLEKIVTEDIYRQLSCQHQFHPNCISDWFKEQNTCPICRAESI